jgi:hypothetical protein
MIGGLIEKSRLRLRLCNEDGTPALRAHFARRVTIPMRSTTRRSDRSQARFDSYTRGG